MAEKGASGTVAARGRARNGRRLLGALSILRDEGRSPDRAHRRRLQRPRGVSPNGPRRGCPAANPAVDSTPPQRRSASGRRPTPMSTPCSTARRFPATKRRSSPSNRPRASRWCSAPSSPTRGSSPAPKDESMSRRPGAEGTARNRNLDAVMPGVPESVRALSLMVWSPDLRLHQLRTLRSLQGNGAQRESVLRDRRRRGRQPRPTPRADMMRSADATGLPTHHRTPHHPRAHAR